jgi:hypothetical protein
MRRTPTPCPGPWLPRPCGRAPGCAPFFAPCFLPQPRPPQLGSPGPSQRPSCLLPGPGRRARPACGPCPSRTRASAGVRQRPRPAADAGADPTGSANRPLAQNAARPPIRTNQRTRHILSPAPSQHRAPARLPPPTAARRRERGPRPPSPPAHAGRSPLELPACAARNFTRLSCNRAAGFTLCVKRGLLQRPGRVSTRQAQAQVRGIDPQRCGETGVVCSFGIDTTQGQRRTGRGNAVQKRPSPQRGPQQRRWRRRAYCGPASGASGGLGRQLATSVKSHSRPSSPRDQPVSRRAPSMEGTM